MQESSKTSLSGDRESEDMQDYLARMNKQLAEMQSHFQTVAPRRESLARATERYLQRKAGTADTTGAAGQPAAGTTSLSAHPSVCRRHSSSEDAAGPQNLYTQPVTSTTAAATQSPRRSKHQSDAGASPAAAILTSQYPAAVANSTGGLPASPFSPAAATPPRRLSREPSWEPQSEQPSAAQQLNRQTPQTRTALFHSPQQKRSFNSRGQSESGSSKLSKAASSSLQAAFEAAAANAEEVEGSRVCIVSRNASEAGSRAASRAASFKWQQPTPSATPEKAGGKQRPPRGRALSQGGYPQHQQQQLQPAAAAKSAASSNSARSLGQFAGSKASSPNSRISSRSNSARFASTGGGPSSSRGSDAAADIQSSSSSTGLEAAAAAAAAPPSPPAASTRASLTDPQSEHELFAVINDAMEAATAAVNKPEILTNSPSLRRRTADDADAGSRSSSSSLGVAAGFRRGSSLKGLAIAAAGWARPDEAPAVSRFLQNDSSNMEGNNHQVAEPQQQAALQLDDQRTEQQERPPIAAAAVQDIAEAVEAPLMSNFSITDIGASEFVCQGSVYDADAEEPLEPAVTQPPTGATADDSNPGFEAQPIALELEALNQASEDAPLALSGARVTEQLQDGVRNREDPAASEAAVLAAPNNLSAEQQLEGFDSPVNAAASPSSSSSPWRRAASEPGSRLQQQRDPTHGDLQQQQQQWDTPTKAEPQQQTGTPTKQHHTWTPTKQLQQLKSWFSEVRRSPARHDSPTQGPRHASDSGFSPAAAAAAAVGAAGPLHNRAPSSGSLLAGSGTGSHLEDLPLHMLGQSGSIRSRSSAGSQLAAAVGDRSVELHSSDDNVRGSNARSSRGSRSDIQTSSIEFSQQQPQAAVAAHAAAAVRTGGVSVTGQLQPATVYGAVAPSSAAAAADTAASTDELVRVESPAGAGSAMTADQTSEPGILHASLAGSAAGSSSSSTEAAEQDEVLFGSPASSPASSYAQLQFAAVRQTAGTTASRFRAQGSAGAVVQATAVVPSHTDDNLETEDLAMQKQQQWQQQQEEDDDADDMTLLAVPAAAAADAAPSSTAAAAADDDDHDIDDDDEDSVMSDIPHSLEGRHGEDADQTAAAASGAVHDSSSPTSSLEISTSLDSSSIGGEDSPDFDAAAFMQQLAAVERGHEMSNRSHTPSKTAAAAAASPEVPALESEHVGTTGSRSAAARVPSFKISISPEASLVDEDSNLQQQLQSQQLALLQQQQQQPPPAWMSRVAAADPGRSFAAPNNAEESGDIVVEGHSMQLPDFVAPAAEAGPDTHAVAITSSPIATAAGGPAALQQQQQDEQHSHRLNLQGDLQPGLMQQGEPDWQAWQPNSQQQQNQQKDRAGYMPADDHKSAATGFDAAAPAVISPTAAAKPSWSERVLGKITAALKSGSSRQRVKSVSNAGAKTAASSAAKSAAAAAAGTRSAPGVASPGPPTPSATAVSPTAAAAAAMLAHTPDTAVQGKASSSSSAPQRQQKHMIQQDPPAAPIADDSQMLAAAAALDMAHRQAPAAGTQLQQQQLPKAPQSRPTEAPAGPMQARASLLAQQTQQQPSQQQQQQQGFDMVNSSRAKQQQADSARILDLSRAAAVAVAGVGVAAVQGTPEPHLVSCGSTLHAPTLAAVSLLLASSSCAAAAITGSSSIPTASAGSSSSGDASPVVLAVSAASVAVAAAALVAAWELEGVDLAAAEASMSDSAAAAAEEGTSGDHVINSVTFPAPSARAPAASHVTYSTESQLLTPGAISITDINSSHDPAAAAAVPETSPGAQASPQLGVELSGASSSQLSGLPELVADVSKSQYSRPGSAVEYDASRYTEPVSPLPGTDGSVVSGVLTDSSPEVQQQQQQRQQWGAVTARQQQQPVGRAAQQLNQQPQQQQQWQRQEVAQQQQQQQHRKQLSGSSWSGKSSPRAIDVVWLPQKTNQQWPAQQQQQPMLAPTQQQQQQQALQPAGGNALSSATAAADNALYTGGSSSSSRALSAVQQLKQRQLHRRISIGANSSMGGGVPDDQHADPQQQQQQVQQQRVQHQLPSADQGELCLGHGVMGEPLQQQQQQQWTSQQQQPTPQQEISCTNYYRQLVQQQQALEQQRQQQQVGASTNNIAMTNLQQNGRSSLDSAGIAPGSGSAAGPRQMLALAKLRQQRQQRLTQQNSIKSDTSTATMQQAEWGSAGGTDAEQQWTTAAAGQQQQQQYTNSQYQPVPVTRTAWGDPAAAAAQEYQQQQQQPDGHQQQRSGPALNTRAPAAAATAAAVQSRGWSTDTGDVSADGSGAAAAAGGSGGAKPFLKRKSRSIVSQKLDWSGVQSRTVHKLDDRCILPAKSRRSTSTKPSYDPALAAAQSRAGLMSHGPKSAAAGGARSSASRSTRTSPHSGYEPGYEMEIRSSTYYRQKAKGQPAGSGSGTNAGSSSPATVGLNSKSRIPTAAAALAGPGGYSISRQGGTGAASGPVASAYRQGSGMQRQLSGRRSSGSDFGAGFGDSGLDPEAPLDDLLSHVNNLIKEFDRMYK